MSLQVWLPLNGDLKNQGLSNIVVTNNGATIDNNGKIGKCYYFDGTATNYINTTYSTAIGTSDFSIAMWIKIPTLTSGTYYAICTSKTTAAASAGFGIYWNYSQKKFLWSTADGSGATEIWMAQTVDSIVYDKWIHLVMVRNNSDSKKGYFYINGQRYELASIPAIRNITTDTKLFIGRCTGGSYLAKMYLNDFRIYDHALSDKEVEEISKGLVLHYKLDSIGNRSGNPNLGNSSANYSNQQLENLYTANGWGGDAGTVTYYSNGGYNNLPYKVYHKTATGSGGIYRKTDNDIIIEEGKTYTFSCWIKSSRNYTESAYGFNINRGSDNYYINYGASLILTTDWKFFSKTFTATTEQAGNYGEMSIIYDDNVTDYYVYYSGFKVEEGTKATSWVNPKENNQSIVYDSSGYNNDGIIAGTLMVSENTSKYKYSTIFDGNTAAIQTPNLKTMITDKIYTISCWTYKTQIGSKNYQTIYGGPSGFELEARSSSTTSPLFRIHNWGGGTTPYEFGQWYHFCFVHTDDNSKLYINGELKITGTSTNIPSGNYFIGAWNTSSQQNYDGNISDFRIYATALTEEQVLELYNTSASIDNNGNVYARELVEI